MVAGRSIGTLERTAARMRSQSRKRISAMVPNPHAHTPSTAMGAQSLLPRVGGATGNVSGNGWAICTIVNDTAGTAIFWAAGAH